MLRIGPTISGGYGWQTLARELLCIGSMKQLATTLALGSLMVSLAASLTGCVPANEVNGAVGIRNGQSQCTDEDGDLLRITVTAYDDQNNVADDVTMKCGGAYTLALDAGAYRLDAYAEAKDPLFGAYWTAGHASTTITVVDGQTTVVPALVIAVD